MQEILVLFQILIVLMTIVIHEVSHGYAAKLLGDDTAENAGRLTLNPLKHLDPIGSVILPLVLYFAGGFVFGWAKPVPYNELNFRNQRTGTIIVAAAGAASNLVLAVIFGLVIRLSVMFGLNSLAFLTICSFIVQINIVLAIFNLIPIPPLDGSRILFSLLPTGARKIQVALEKYSLIILVIFIFFFWQYLSPAVYALFKLLTGVAF